MKIRRIGYYGGSFDPVHEGHLAIGEAVARQFALDEFVYIPAFHAPHKVRSQPTSPYDRYAMLCLATRSEGKQRVSRMEIEMPGRPYTIETLTALMAARPDDQAFFVMGADSWMDITSWREWQSVLSITNHIVMTRPGVEVRSNHVTSQVRDRIVDLRGRSDPPQIETGRVGIYITDAVSRGVSGTEIRRKIREGDERWRTDLTPEVANYIEKYQIYK